MSNNSAIPPARLEELRRIAIHALEGPSRTPTRNRRAETARSGGWWMEIDPAELLALVEEVERGR